MASRSDKILNLLNREGDPPDIDKTLAVGWSEIQKDCDQRRQEKENIPLENVETYQVQPIPASLNPVTNFNTIKASKRSSRSSSSSSSGSNRSTSSSSSNSSRSSSSSSTSSKVHSATTQPDVSTVDTNIIELQPEPNQDSQSSYQISTSPSLLTLQNVEPIMITRGVVVDYQISPVNNTDESDADLSDNDPTYSTSHPRRRTLSCSSTASDVTPTTNTTIVEPLLETDTSSRNKGKKRKADPTKWKQNMRKIKRNLGQGYYSTFAKKQVNGREMKPPCTQKCRLKCSEKFSQEERAEHFKSFWALGDLQLQRLFVLSCMTTVTPKYKYTNAEKPREPNNAYYITKNNDKIKVCKTFFINTFDISAKMIRTVRSIANNGNFIADDKRGKHQKHNSVDETLKKDIVDFINTIPRIESHYLRASTSREYISGGKSIAELFRDFEELQKSKALNAGRFHTFSEIFRTEFNIGFFQPKKDQCDLCLEYNNSSSSQSLSLQEKYNTHLEEKTLSREEKKKARQNIDEYNLCVCFDVQAIMQSPNGDSSAFYYKSKLNSYNFTMSELNKLIENVTTEDDYKSYEDVHCYFWDETQGKRGAIEIGSCVLDYLKKVSDNIGDREFCVTFISDNCCGQNKNKYLAALLMYAVTNIKNLKKITHNNLIKGHTQNEADNVHSLIQKQITKDLKCGPIYTPLQYISAIQRAKKTGKPFIIHSLNYDFFYDVKDLQDKWGYNYNVNEQRDSVVWNDIKVMMFTKDKPFSFFYKTSYKDDFKEVNVRNKRKKMLEHGEILISLAYDKPFELSLNKKNDLKELISKKLIDSYHANYFNSMLV